MSTLRQLVHGRVDPADHRLLKHEADARGISRAKERWDLYRDPRHRDQAGSRLAEESNSGTRSR